MTVSKPAVEQADPLSPDILGNSIVLIGKVEQEQFQPTALLKNGLIRLEDLDDLKIEAFFPQLVVLNFKWIIIHLTEERLTLTTPTANPVFEPLRDFLVAVLDLMSSVRLTGLGINTEMHFGLRTEGKWHALGHELVPKEHIWSKVVSKPGMMSLALRGWNSDEAKEQINIWVEPSARIKYGAYVRVNNHFDIDPSSEDGGVDSVSDVLSDRWAEIVSRADSTMAQFREFAMNVREP